MDAPPGRITELLHQAYQGREGALDEVMEIVYDDLRRVAANHMRARYGGNLAGVTLQPTALVNEAFLRLVKQRKQYDSRGHFFAIATRVMLRVLMDYDRRRGAVKRGGDRLRVSLSGVARRVGQEPSAEIGAFVEALERLEKLDARTAEVVKLQMLWGLTVPETAEAMDVSVSTVEREWRFARRWLAAALGDDRPSAPSS